MKNTTFITTFSQKGYKHYGKSWIDSFVKNTSDVKAVIYTDFELYVSDSRITVLNFNEEIPNHKQWIDQYNGLRQYDKEKPLGIKFSYKSFVIIHALKNLSEYVVWVDGDCVFKPNMYNNLAKTVLNNKFIAIQVDKVGLNDLWKTENHVESGIVIFDSDHVDKPKFLKRFETLYEPENIAKMNKPYDGFVLMKACEDLDYEDLLPEDYTILDYNPQSTFTHYELMNRFTHNIGNKND